MDRLLKAEIIGTVRKAMEDVMESNQESWLTGEELCKQFQMFTPGWLKRYGYKLPRTWAIITEDDGQQHSTGWAYPRNKIQRMAREGRLSML